MFLIASRQRNRGSPDAVGGGSSLTVGPWVLPTLYEDGSAIGTITDQKIYYDTISRMGSGTNYTNSVSVGNGSSLTFVVTGLVATTLYYYAMTTIVGGVESNLGPEYSGVSVP